MSKRMLHENITKSEKFSLIGFEAECLYNRLLTQTDDYGNVLGSNGYIKDICFPRKKNKKEITYMQIEKWLSELIYSGLLIKYIVDEVSYLHFNRFEDFQTLRKDRIKNSSIPYYDSLRSNGCQHVNQMVTKCPHEVEVEVEVEEEVKEEVKLEVNKKNIPTFTDFLNYALEKEPLLSKKSVQFKYDAWVENGWKNGNDKPIKNWKSSLLNTIPHLAKDTKEQKNKNFNFKFDEEEGDIIDVKASVS